MTQAPDTIEVSPQPKTRSTMVSKEEFDKAAEEVKAYAQCTNDEQLELYGWFKQANVGDVNTGARGPDQAVTPDRPFPGLTKPIPDPCSSPRHARLQRQGQVGRLGEVQGHLQGGRHGQVRRGRREDQGEVRLSDGPDFYPAIHEHVSVSGG